MESNSRWLFAAATLLTCALFVTSCNLFQSYATEGTTSAPIALGSAVTGTLSHPGQVTVGGSSYYKFAAAMNHSYTVTIDGLTGDADLSVYGDAAFSSGALIGSSTNTGTTPDVVTAMASYVTTLYVSVSGAEDAGYTLSVADSGATASEGSIAAPANLGVATSTTVTHNGTANSIDGYYTVTGSASDTVSLTGLSADLDLYVYSDAAFSTLLNSSTASRNGERVSDSVAIRIRHSLHQDPSIRGRVEQLRPDGELGNKVSQRRPDSGPGKRTNGFPGSPVGQSCPIKDRIP